MENNEDHLTSKVLNNCLGEDQTNYSLAHQEMLMIFWIMATQHEHRIICCIFNQGPRIYTCAWFQLWVST